MNWFRRVKNFFKPKKVDFKGPVPKGHISNKFLPETVMDSNAIIYNVYFDKNLNKHIVIIRQLEKELRV